MKNTTTTITATPTTPSRYFQKSWVLTLATILSILLPVTEARAWIFTCVTTSTGQKGCCFVNLSCDDAETWAQETGGKVRSCIGFKAAQPGTVITIKKEGAFLTVKGKSTPIYKKMFDPKLPPGFIEKMSKELKIPIVKEDVPSKGTKEPAAKVDPKKNKPGVSDGKDTTKDPQLKQ